jgi:hypothetical protein
VHSHHRSVYRLALLALILLVVQTGAILHTYSHGHPARSDGTAGTEQCLYCKAAAPLLGAGASPASLLLLLVVLQLLVVVPLAVTCTATFRHPAFRSRAPPQHP